MNGEACHALRNFGVIAHIDAGKTTLTERILFTTGKIRYCGEVQEGTTVSDFLPQERERGISIVSAAVSCSWRECQLNIVDTPGHVDFTSEVERVLRVMDGVVAVFCGAHGVQAQSETVWRQASRYGLPVLGFVNKLDREGADFFRTVHEVSARLGIAAFPVQFPLYRDGIFSGLVDLLTGRVYWHRQVSDENLSDDEWLETDDWRSRLVEKLAEDDDEIMQEYLQNLMPPPEMLKKALRKAVCRRSVMAMFAGVALENVGVRELLDGIVDFLPSPGNSVLCHEDGKVRRISFASGMPACLLVFKIVTGDWQGDWLAARIYHGTVRAGMTLHNVTRTEDFTVERILRLRAGDSEEISSAEAGDIVGLVGKVDEVRTGDTLGGDGMELVLENMVFPSPVISQTIEGVSAEDRQKLPQALKLLSRQDPTVRVSFESELGQWVVSGMGELQLAVITDRLRTECGLETRTGLPRVSYLATVKSGVRVKSQFIKHLTPEITVQAEITLGLEPLPRGSGIVYVLTAVEKKLAPVFLEALRRGLEDGVDTGYRHGIPLTDTRVTVFDVSDVANETSELAFLTVSRQAMGEALSQAGVDELEPVMRLEVSSPQDQVGNVIADLTARRSRIAELDSLAPGTARLVAFTPLAEMFGYASALRSLTGGRAEFAAEPFRYESRPEKA